VRLYRESSPESRQRKSLLAARDSAGAIEHRKNEKQEATIARQQKQIDALTAGLQKVSAQLELSKAAPQTVLNGQ